MAVVLSMPNPGFVSFSSGLYWFMIMALGWEEARESAQATRMLLVKVRKACLPTRSPSVKLSNCG